MRKNAVLYIRVSFAGQVKKDYDPEGISLPAQRLACERKAAEVGAVVIDEYVEAGISGTKMDNRPAFQQMLARIKTQRDVDYVIFYNLSRMARNRLDDAMIVLALRAVKVTLVSTQENIDETPAGQLTHGILAAINEYRSAADGADIKAKMGHKARTGGTLGKAPIGYLNVRDMSTGYEVRAVAVDKERAPFVKLAFELYATGEWSMESLAAELTRRGLRTRPTARHPGTELSRSKVHAILRDRYYVGKIIYQGEEYPGRHEALVSEELFARVSAQIGTRTAAGERLRKWPHYLKGTIFCAECEKRGVDARMVLQRVAKPNGDEYFYFFCMERQAGRCRSRYLPMHTVEDFVVRHYDGITLPEGFAARVRVTLEATLADKQHTAELVRDGLQARLRDLDTRQHRLLDLVEQGVASAAQVRDRLRAIQDDREAFTRELSGEDDRLERGAAVIRGALDMASDIPALYRQSTDPGRRASTRRFSPDSTSARTGWAKNA